MSSKRDNVELHDDDSMINLSPTLKGFEREKESVGRTSRSSLDDNFDTSSTESDDEDAELLESREAQVDEEVDISSNAANSPPKNEKEKPVSWSSLPRKDQLFILALARMVEPVVITSINAYMFFMLRSFDPSLPDSTISSQAGFLSAGFTAAQCITAVIWGRVADRASVGRKNVVIIGLLGTLISAIGFGFSRSFAWALLFRCLGGALNGNVSILRTMTSEVIREKKYQTKAFLLMPIMFNVGILIGPLLGGWFQDPIHTFPRAFGPGSTLGGKEGVKWMVEYPYAMPNLLNATLVFVSLVLVIFCLEEVLPDSQTLQVSTNIFTDTRRSPTSLRSGTRDWSSYSSHNLLQITANKIQSGGSGREC